MTRRLTSPVSRGVFPGCWIRTVLAPQKRDERRVAAATPAGSVKGCHFFNSFFLNKLLDEGRGYNYAGVKRWTKRIDIFAKKRIFFPVNISNTHWCMAVVHMDDRRVQYYDSMGGAGRVYLEVRSAVRPRRARYY